MIEIIGWISATLLALCGIPQVYKSFTERKTVGVSQLFLWLWFGGEVFGLVYVLYNQDLPLVFNYGMNTLFTGIILYYACFPKGS